MAIKLADVLKRIDQGEVFGIEFVTANRHTKEGGTVKKFDRLTKLTGTSGQRQFAKKKKPVRRLGDPNRVRRNPMHWDNQTRNLVVPGTEEIVKVHARLITRFNKEKVVW